MNKYFADRVVIVTGASAGIGKALARQLTAAGAKLTLVARRRDRLEQLADEIGVEQSLVQAGDIADEAFCREVIAQTVATFGSLDILVNNAGISMNAMFADCESEVFRRLMAVNYFGSLYTTLAALPHLEKSQGSLLFISSIVGKRGFPTRSGYSASKFAVQGLFESLRCELTPKGIHVGILSPGYTATEIREVALAADGQARGEAGMTTGDVMPPEAVADAIMVAIARRKREVILTMGGKALVGLNKILPGVVDRLAARTIG